MGEGKHFISIWFFIGCLLAFYGVLIIGAGIYGISNPPAQSVVLQELHPAIWWGGILIALGLFYAIRFRPGRD